MSTKSFNHPLSDTEPDIILRSSDGVNFNVHKSIMVHQSSVFRDILSIPQEANTSNDTDDDQTTSQSMDVSEDSMTLELLLQFCYLCADPVGDLDLYLEVSKAAEKYDMKTVLHLVKRYMASEMRALVAATDDPFRLYAISCAYRMVEEGQLAAKATLRRPMIGQYPPKVLDLLPARAYHELLEYRKLCIAVLSPLLTSWKSMYQNHSYIEQCSGCQGAALRCSEYGLQSSWLTSYFEQIKKDFSEVTTGDMIRSLAHLRRALVFVDSCSKCRARSRVPTDLARFNEDLASAVDAAIAKVSQCSPTFGLDCSDYVPIWLEP